MGGHIDLSSNSSPSPGQPRDLGRASLSRSLPVRWRQGALGRRDSPSGSAGRSSLTAAGAWRILPALPVSDPPVRACLPSSRGDLPLCLSPRGCTVPTPVPPTLQLCLHGDGTRAGCVARGGPSRTGVVTLEPTSCPRARSLHLHRLSHSRYHGLSLRSCISFLK